MNLKNTKENVINSIYLVAIFVFALLVSTQALARKVNTYQTMTNPILFYVDKHDISVASGVSGRVNEVLVSLGSHVNKGDLLVKIDREAFDGKMKALEEVAANNLSARTELDVLRKQSESFNIYATQDGVIYKINATEGSYVQPGAEVVVLFADKDAHLLSNVTPAQYGELQARNKISIYSARLKQSFSVKLSGIGKVTDDYEFLDSKTTKKVRKYELIFDFEDADTGAVFIEQESLQLMNDVDRGGIKRPTARVANLWNALILGK